MAADFRIIVTALAFVSLGIVAIRAQGLSPSTTEAQGAWRIVSLPGTEPDQENVALRTVAIDRQDAAFSLVCRKEVPFYYFEIRNLRLQEFAKGEDAPIVIHLANQEPIRFLVASAGDGSVVIQERVHQTAFSVLFASLVQSGAAMFDLSVGPHQWRFSQDGFASLTDDLIKRCGFALGPLRSRTQP